MRGFWSRLAGRLAMVGLVAAAISGCVAHREPAGSALQTDSSAPRAAAAQERQIEDLIARMSIERKVAQLIQPQINSFTAKDMETYRFGSYLNGGNGGPYGDEFAPPAQWLRLADEMWEASTRPLPGDEPVIPTMWGTDAVHGHTNVIGATIFPHNIALGATHDPDLVRRVGEATAAEIKATGIEWNFSPTIAVARDDRWGRTYESYSEDPELVAKLGAALIEGLQGRKGDPDWLGERHVIATAKHFFGDGGTAHGVDQGDVNGDLEKLKAIHAYPYRAAIASGVEAIMASFNSINGTKMHGNRALLTDYLRGELGFDGLVVGDWNGHGQIKGCSVTDCPQALLAGLDIYMVPDDWKALHTNLVAQVKDGTIPLARLDEAVRRVLRVKQRAGLLLPGARKPSQRELGGDFSVIGSREHRAIAREAVAKSQVILKNNGVLPIRKGAHVLVAGSAADNIGQAAGGWTLEWQGSASYDRARFPGATSIWEGLREAIAADGGRAQLSPTGEFTQKPDVAIVVFGEKPYAEFAGDRKHLAFDDEEGLQLLRRLRAQGVPTVAVFLSGRPLWVNRELNAADAFVAAWLPGSEGAGVADVLTGKVEASGRLSFSWPARCDGEPLNDAHGALFPLGYGLRTGEVRSLDRLSEECRALELAAMSEWFARGRLGKGVAAYAIQPGLELPSVAPLEALRGEAFGVHARGIDRNAQEDARAIALDPGATLVIRAQQPLNAAYRIVYRVGRRPEAAVSLHGVNEKDEIGPGRDLTQTLSIAEGKGWREMVIAPDCLGGASAGIAIHSEGAFAFDIAAIRREEPSNGGAQGGCEL